MFAYLAVALLVAQPDQPPPRQLGPRRPEPPPPWELPREPSLLGPADTAFPDLKPPTHPKADPAFKGDRAKALAAYNQANAELMFPKLPDLPANPTPLQKVWHEQARAGIAFLQKTQQVIEVGRWDSQFYQNYLQVAADTYRVAAELHDTPAGRVRCYEARVILMKEFERFIDARVRTAIDPSTMLDAARFQRLQAEADLLKLLAEVEKAGKNCPAPPAAIPCYLPCPPVQVTPVLLQPVRRPR